MDLKPPLPRLGGTMVIRLIVLAQFFTVGIYQSRIRPVSQLPSRGEVQEAGWLPAHWGRPLLPLCFLKDSHVL